MTQPAMSPDELRAQLRDAVGHFNLAGPRIDALQQRAHRRRRKLVGSVVAGAFVSAALAVLLVGNAIGSSSRRNASVQIGHGAGGPRSDYLTLKHGPPPIATRPVPTTGGTPSESHHQQTLREYPKRCGGRYDRWQLVQAQSATAENGSVRIAAHPGYARCGGPSDIAYLHHRSTETLTLAPTAVVQVVDLGSKSGTTPIPAAQLRGYLRQHRWSNFFRYVGPKGAVSELIELYHP